MIRSFFPALGAGAPLSLLAAFAALALAPSVASAQYIWNPSNNNNGQWVQANRWTGGPAGTFPNAVDEIATFNIPLSTAGSGNFNVQISNTPGTSVTVGHVTINHDSENTFNTRFGANGNGTITLESSSGPATWTENAGAPDTSTGNTNIFAPVTFGSDTVITTNHNIDANSSLSFGSTNNSPGGVTAAPGITVTKEGAANLEFAIAPEGPGEGFQGNLVANQGGVRLEANVFTNAAAVTINSGAQLQLAGGGAVTDWNLAPGASLTLSGAGKAEGANPAGALRYQHGNSSANFNSPITLAGDSTVFVNASPEATPPRASRLVLTQGVSGDGGLIKSGGGVLELTQAGSYEGSTSIEAGTLVVSNTSGSATGAGAVSVAAGASLSGSGSIAGPVSFVDGILAPGTSPGTITLGATSFSAGSQLFYELDTPGVVGGGVNDLAVVNGDLSLGGTLVVQPLAGFGIGTYRLFDYTGSLLSNALGISGLPSEFSALLDTSTPGQVNLQVQAVPEPATWVLLTVGTVAAAVTMRRRKQHR